MEFDIISSIKESDIIILQLELQGKIKHEH